MRIVVAGGTGFLGRHIARALLDAGHEVVALGRAPEKATRIPELREAEAVRGDVTEPESLLGSLAGAEAVVGVVQFPNHPVEVPRKGLTYDRYDRGGTVNLLAEAKRAGIGRYFYISGAGADPGSPRTWYRAKGLAEDAIRASGLEFCILRPSWAYGPEDRALNRYRQMARFSPVVPRIGVRPQLIQPVYVGDIATSVSRAFETKAAWDQTFEIGGPDVMTMDEIIHTLLAVMGVRRLVLPVPTLLAKIGTAPMALLPKPFMTPQGIEFAVQDGVVDTGALVETLDVHPVGLREGLKRYIGSRR